MVTMADKPLFIDTNYQRISKKEERVMFCYPTYVDELFLSFSEEVGMSGNFKREESFVNNVACTTFAEAAMMASGTFRRYCRRSVMAISLISGSNPMVSI